MRKFWIASVAAGVLLFLVLFLLLGPGSRRPIGEPAGEVPAGSVDERSAPVARSAADLVPDAEEKKKDPEPEVADIGPPLLRGIVLGEGTPLPGARVLLFSVRRVEKAIDRLEGHVMDSAGMPDFKTIISIVREELEGFRRSALAAVTGEKGVFEFRRIDEGGYFILTLAEGWLFRFGDVASVATGRTQDLQLDLGRGAAIAGQVVGANGEGLAGLRVLAEPRPAGVAGLGQILRRLLRAINGEFLRGPFEATSGAGGAFTIASLPPGLYDLAASVPKGPEARLRGVETGSLDALIYIGEGARAHGSFADEGGVPAAGQAFQLDRQDDLIQLPLPLAGFTDLANTVHQWLGDGPISLTAGARGEFRLGPLSPGSYRLSVNQSGLMPLVETFEVDWGQDLDLGVLRVDRGETITGWVRLEEGSTIEGARVVGIPMKIGFLNAGSAVGDVMSGRTAASTDASGAFKLSGLVNGPYRLTATYPGRASGIKKDIRPGGEPVELVLARGFTLAGRVVAKAGGAPVPGVRVEAGGVQAETDREGRFLLEGVVREDSSPSFMFFGMSETNDSRESDASERRRSVSIKASKSGYLTARETVRAGEGSPEVRIELERTAEIAGTVLDPDGKPAPGALVRLTFDVKENDLPPGFDFFDPAMVFLAATVADPEGKFHFKDFRGSPGDNFRVVADHLTYARGGSESFSLARVSDAPLEVEVRLQKGCRVHGTVTDGQRPVAGAAVRLQRRAPSDAGGENERRGMEAMFMTMAGLPKGGQVVHTDREGKFAHERILPNHYSLSAEMAGYIESSAQKLSLEAGNEQEVSLVLDPGGTIAGSVVDPEGNPIPLARLRLLQEREGADGEFLMAQKVFGGAYKSARSGPDGVFRITGLPSMRFTLLADAKGYSTRELKAIEPGGKELSIELAPAAALWGRVADAAGGRPIKTFTVALERDGVEDIPGLPAGGREHSNADGRFTHEGLEAGTYEVEIGAAGYVPIFEEVQLAAGAAIERTFLLVQGGRIRGTVVDATTGQPIDRVTVRIYRAAAQIKSEEEGGGPKTARAPRRSQRRRDRRSEEGDRQEAPAQDPQRNAPEPWSEPVRTDREGRFLLEGVPPEGTWTIEGTSEEFIPERTESAAPAAGQDLQVDFKLRKGLVVSGWVRDRGGNPLAGARVSAEGVSEANARTRRRVRSGEQGEFRIAGLEKGSYKLRAFGPDNEPTGTQPTEITLEESRDGIELTVP